MCTMEVTFMAMMINNVIDQRHVNLFGKRSLVRCDLMCSHKLVSIDRRLLHF